MEIVIFAIFLGLTFLAFRALRVKEHERWDATIGHLEAILRTMCIDHKIPEHHGFQHFVDVANHGRNAIKHGWYTRRQSREIILACYLHDVDDRKIAFPKVKGQTYPNARAILKEIGCSSYEDVVIEMIDLVSASKNKNSVPADPKKRYYLVPRECDRICALGTKGIERCLDFTKDIGNPLFTVNTPMKTTDFDVHLDANKYSFEEYDGKSLSAIDHFYDKLLHLCVCHSGNKYTHQRLELEYQIITHYLANIGKHMETLMKYGYSVIDREGRIVKLGEGVKEEDLLFKARDVYHRSTQATESKTQ